MLLRITENSALARKTINVIKEEIKAIVAALHFAKVNQLRQENAELYQAVENAKRELIAFEIQNGLKQVPLPTKRLFGCGTPVPNNNLDTNVGTSAPTTTQSLEHNTIKKPKEKKTTKDMSDKKTDDDPIDIGRLDLRIGHVIDVQRHPDADTLYVLKINCGDAQPRTVCSGLVNHVSMETLKNRSVIVLCNLKAAKMRGVTSEAMVMCASSAEGVEVLSPPESTTAGDLVICEGFMRNADAVLNPKKKIFESVAQDLHTDLEKRACYKGVPWKVEGKEGLIVSATLTNVNVK